MIFEKQFTFISGEKNILYQRYLCTGILTESFNCKICDTKSVASKLKRLETIAQPLETIVQLLTLENLNFLGLVHFHVSCLAYFYQLISDF